MEVLKKLDIAKLKSYMANMSPETKVYIGADSERKKIKGDWYAIYAVAIVVHIDGCRGSHLFGEVVMEKDYDRNKNRPAVRLMTEVYKASEMYLRLADVFHDFEVEVHLDINPDVLHGSSCVVSQALGYIKGTCNVTPLIKPEAFAASFAADRLGKILNGN